MDSKTALEIFHHDSQFLWLHYRLKFEMETEGLRRRIRLKGTRWPTMKIDENLQRLLNVR